ncbi:NUDIX hydrolase [Corynebacterium timonense]|uniref:8-oxo-dGTP pyrophosphatase MutT, NUDIX family n=1 Tax=Corynebacterium timonense TaxID=441500 RepID=A0A1H1TK85_9CORY|nr:CoA pyrophosphatase [Corynebacterium timonense]SDS60630.1 8-oxo-dGTP pyrophosphatase MutT, NUDIX family [Corynebacterium timonense]
MSDVDLTPAAAPAWLAPLVERLGDGSASALVSERLAGRSPGSGRPDDAAVLMLFVGGAPHAAARPGDAGVLITHRTPTMRSHSGQMAFPGGRIDPGDGGPVDAALREAREETGLERWRVAPLATLTSVTTAGSKRSVRPVLAYSADPGRPYAASPAETDDVFFAPVAQLLDPANRLQVSFLGWDGPAFEINGYVVWGFTGVLLDVLFAAAGWEEPWDRGRVVPLEAALRGSRNDENLG